MGAAIDTVIGAAVNPGAAFTAAAPASGDSFTVRAYRDGSIGRIERIIRAGAAAGAVRVRSPLMHDNAQGLRFTSSESPAVMLLPPERGEYVQRGDNMIVELTGGAAETDLAALVMSYDDLPGASARLHSWGDISGIIKHLKSVQVAVAGGQAAGTWVDIAINTTEDLLHAGSDYALLGYTTDVALGVIALRGIDTGNLRVGAPGSTSTFYTGDYFIRWGDREGQPRIPVFNANNKASTFLSVAHNAAVPAANVELILAELSQTLPS